MRGSGRLGAALALGLAMSACAPMAGPDGVPRRLSTVTVSGAGTATAPPDMAEITTGVVSRAATAAQAQVHVKVRDLPSLGRVLDQQVAQGANSVYGIRFGLIDPAPLLDEARKRAMVDARRKAELYAAAAGLKVGRVVSVQEAGAASPRPEVGARAMMSAVPVAAGEQEIQASVSVTYALEP